MVREEIVALMFAEDGIVNSLRELPEEVWGAVW